MRSSKNHLLYRIRSVVIELIRGKSRLHSETVQFTPWNMIIPSTSISPEWPLALNFHSHNGTRISHLPMTATHSTSLILLLYAIIPRIIDGKVQKF